MAKRVYRAKAWYTGVKLPSKSKGDTTNVSASHRRGRRFLGYERKETVKSLRYDYKKLKDRLARVKAKFGETPAIKEFEERGLDKFSTKGKSMEELDAMRTDIDYLSGLKTSTVKGASAFEEHIKPLLDIYESDRDTYDTIITMYNRFVEENALFEKFKYQLLDMIGDLVAGGVSTRQIRYEIMKFKEMLYENELLGKDVKYVYDFGGHIRIK